MNELSGTGDEKKIPNSYSQNEQIGFTGNSN